MIKHIVNQRPQIGNRQFELDITLRWRFESNSEDLVAANTKVTAIFNREVGQPIDFSRTIEKRSGDVA
ncbi:MAG: hypothetical protein EPO26_11115 [Chloroflexota bacterium]|nr:MAG: hypothetical protein EPO26_11115 [Chloroflexota bacterium]